MPRLPDYLAREGLPTQGGVPRSTVGIPVAQEPQADPAALTQRARALGGAGEALQQSGALLVRTEELAAHRQRAQDTLTGKAGGQDYRVEALTLQDTLRQGDYATFPERFLEESERLIVERGAQLSPGARAIFVEDARQFRAVLHQQNLAERTRRTGQETAFTFQREIQQVTEMYHRATSDFERAFFKDQLVGLTSAFVDTGLVDGLKAAKVLQETDKAIALEQAQMTIRAQPGQAVRELAGMMQGTAPTLPGLQGLPPETLPGLFDDALQVLSKSVHLQESLNAGAKRQLQETQSNVASDYRSQVYKPHADVNTLLGLTEQVDRDRRLQRLSEEDHKDLLSTIQHRIDKLKDDAFKDRDVPAVLEDAFIRVSNADTPADLAQAKQWIEANRGQLSSNSFGSLLDKIRQRSIQDGPENDDVVKEGRRTLLSRAFTAGIVPAIMEEVEPTRKAKTAAALEQYYEEMRRIYTTDGRDAMRRQAIEIGQRLGDTYFPETPATTPAGAETPLLPASMPPAIRKARTQEEAFRIMESLELPLATQRRLFVDFERILPHEGAAPDLTPIRERVEQEMRRRR